MKSYYYDVKGPSLLKIKNDGVYFGKNLVGEYLDGRFVPNLDLMNKSNHRSKTSWPYRIRWGQILKGKKE